MRCPNCQADTLTKWGRTTAGNQRYRCSPCGRTVTDSPAPSPVAPMRLPFDRATLILSMLVEGLSIRGTERVTGHHRDTVGRLLVLAGGKAERLLADLIQDVPVADVEADELWASIGMKEKTKGRKLVVDAEVGDSYTFLSLDVDSKLILAHHVGRRTAPASA